MPDDTDTDDVRPDGGHLPSDRPTSSLSLDTHTGEDVYPDGGRRFNTQPVTCPECDGPLVNGECETAGCPGPDDVDGGEN